MKDTISPGGLRQSRKPTAASFRNKVYLMLLRLQIEEEAFSMAFFRSMVVVQFLIVGHCANSNNLVKKYLDDLLFSNLASSILAACLLFFGSVAFVQTVLVVSHLRGWNIRGTVKTVAALNYWCIYLVHPLFVLLLSKQASDFFFPTRLRSRDSMRFVLSAVGLVLSSAYVSILIVTKCSIPSNGFTSQVSARWTMIFHLLLAFTQLTAEMRDRSEDNTVLYLIFALSGKAFLFGGLLLAARQRIYWHHKSNSLCVKLMARLACVSLVGEVLQSRSGGSASVIWLLIVQALVTKTVSAFSRRQSKINIFESDISHHRFYLGVILLNVYVTTPDHAINDPEELDILFFYKGIWESACSQGRLRSSNRFAGSESVKEESHSGVDREHLCRLVDFVARKQAKDFEYYKLLNLLQVTQITTYFRGSRQVFASLANELGSEFLDRFEAFQMQALWETKLLVLDKGRRDSSVTRDSSLLSNFDFVKVILDGADEAREKNYLDVSRAFRSISVFSGLADSIERIVQLQLQIFHALHEDASFTSSVCREANKSTLEARQAVNNEIESISKTEDVADLYTYYYPSLIFYFGLVKYDVEKSDSFVLFYQKKLVTLLNSSAYRKEKQTAIGMEIDSVAIQVAMERDSLGKIISSTLNANQFLGERVNEGLEGKSINTFLPQVLWENHLKAFESNKVIRVLNKQRPVLMCDLDSNLKQVQLSIKLAPSVTNPVSAFSLMTFASNAKGPSLLLDQDLNVLCSDSSFDKQVMYRRMTLTEGQSSNDKVHLSALSLRLCSSLRIIHRIISHSKSEPDSKKEDDLQSPTNLQVRDRLNSMLNVLIEQNTSAGMLFALESGCPISEVFGSDLVHARIEVVEAVGKQLIKCYISRKSRSKVSAGQDLQMDKSNQMGSEQQVADWMSDDQATNKAVREHNQLQVEYNSEQKESIVSRGLKQLAAATGDSVIHRFDDLLAPAAELVRSAPEKHKGGAGSEEHIRTATCMTDKSASMERSFELKSAVRDVVSLIVEHLQARNVAGEFDHQVRTLQSRPSDGGSNLLTELPVPAWKPEKSRDRLAVSPASPGLDGFRLSPKAVPSQGASQKDKLDNHRVMRLNSPRIGSDMRVAKSLLNPDRDKQSRKIEEKADVLSWVKAMQVKGLFKLKSQASTFFDEQNAQTGNHVPHVATFQSIPRILFYFAVVSCHTEKRTRGQ